MRIYWDGEKIMKNFYKIQYDNRIRIKTLIPIESCE